MVSSEAKPKPKPKPADVRSVEYLRMGPGWLRERERESESVCVSNQDCCCNAGSGEFIVMNVSSTSAYTSHRMSLGVEVQNANRGLIYKPYWPATSEQVDLGGPQEAHTSDNTTVIYARSLISKSLIVPKHDRRGDPGGQAMATQSIQSDGVLVCTHRLDRHL